MAIETKKILIRRGSDISSVSSVDQGELLLDTDDNKLYVGTGSNATKQIANLGDMGVNATAADINKLQNLATTATQLGYLSDVTSAIQSQINGLNADKAPKSNPTFLGSVVVPTPSQNSHAATKSYVDTAISDLVGNAAEALDTLGELSSALDDDASFASTMTTALAAKAPLDSPTFTTQANAPTPAAQDNSTKIATTAYVQGEISNVNGLSGVTADTDELNLLDGVSTSLTTAEISTLVDSDTTTTLQAQLNLKAPLASPALTGTPTAPTAAADTNTTQIATTAFVQSEIAANNATNNEFEFVGKTTDYTTATSLVYTNNSFSGHTFDFDNYDYKIVFEFHTNAEDNTEPGSIRFNDDNGNNYYWLTRSTTADGDTQTITSAEATSIIDFGEGLDADSTNVARTVAAGELIIRKPYTSAPQVANNYQWTYLVTGKALTTAVRYSAGSQYLVESNFYAHWYPTSTTSTHDITKIVLFNGLAAGTVDTANVRFYRRAK